MSVGMYALNPVFNLDSRNLLLKYPPLPLQYHLYIQYCNLSVCMSHNYSVTPGPFCLKF